MYSNSAVRGERSFTHTGSGLAEMAAWLLAQAGAAADVIGVAIEVPHGPVVEALTEHGFVVHSLNPKQLDRFRDRFSPAGAKDDRRDARVLADALRTDRRPLLPAPRSGRSRSGRTLGMDPHRRRSHRRADPAGKPRASAALAQQAGFGFWHMVELDRHSPKSLPPLGG